MTIADHLEDEHFRMMEAITEGPILRDVPDGAKRALRCRCEEPKTYRDEDGDLRCTCGRAV